MKNHLFEENYFHSSNFKDILRNKDIIFKNDIFNDEIILKETKIQNFENIFETENLIENNGNLVINEENYFIKTNSSNNKWNKINTKEKDIGENNLKKSRKKHANEKIFLIEKIDKKKKHMGRRKKEKKYRTKACHDKFNKDNIVRKIKIHFLNAGIKYINKKYNEFQKLKLKPTKQKFLQKLQQKYTDYLTKKEEKIFLSKKLNEILSDTVSKRCKNHNQDYNKKNLKKLMSKGEPKNLIEFLDKTIEDVYKIYISEEKDKIPEFNLKNDLSSIEEDMNEKGENYKIKYKEYALDLISILNEPGKIK